MHGAAEGWAGYMSVSGFGYVLATHMLVDGGGTVRYMYHEAPDDSQDSGWRFFCGDEDDDYVSDPDNIGVYDVSTILAIDPDIRPWLDAPAGTAWEREDGRAEFMQSAFSTADD